MSKSTLSAFDQLLHLYEDRRTIQLSIHILRLGMDPWDRELTQAEVVSRQKEIEECITERDKIDKQIMEKIKDE